MRLRLRVYLVATGAVAVVLLGLYLPVEDRKSVV